MGNLVIRAQYFAIGAHRAIAHKRKYTGLNYDVHLNEVAEILTDSGQSDEVIAAGWLHDVLEDVENIHIEDLQALFGLNVSHLVLQVTDVSSLKDGNRKRRKEIDRERLSMADADAQTVKLADLISNSRDIIVNDSKFAKVYMQEKEALLSVLQKGDRGLHKTASKIIDDYYYLC